jgi:hypothetical protein
MAWIQVRHRVDDYARWKAAYDLTAACKRDHGLKRRRLFRVGGKRKVVLVMEVFETLDQARSFLDSPFLLEVMGRAGVIGAPEIMLVNELDEGVA